MVKKRVWRFEYCEVGLVKVDHCKFIMHLVREPPVASYLKGPGAFFKRAPGKTIGRLPWGICRSRPPTVLSDRWWTKTLLLAVTFLMASNMLPEVFGQEGQGMQEMAGDKYGRR